MGWLVPVVALARGAVTEVVTPGVNGDWAEHAEQLPFLIDRVTPLDRARVRASVERRFSHRRMVSDYVDIYRRVLAATEARREA